MKYNKLLGAFGEEMACGFLVKQGYKILERNFSCKAGELDIIAFDGDTIAFIEVKCRTGTGYGNPSEAVSYYKQSRIVKAALFFMTKNKIFDYMSRFDVIEILTDGTKECTTINLIKNAFEYSGKYGY
ncbi:MAG: YraN family protein [Clostridiales bacterium GWB2_37_7]|nr:MAG: YraN family protein [Clostridiales bacterium GWB2_37_7]